MEIIVKEARKSLKFISLRFSCNKSRYCLLRLYSPMRSITRHGFAP